MNDTQFYTLFFLLVAIALLSSCATQSRPNPAADAIATMMLQPVD